MPELLRYPKYDLDQALDVARVISSRGTGATVSGPELAAMLDYSGTNNGAFLNRLSSARLFGFLDGQGDALRVTDLAERILHPDYPDTEIQARIEAFRSVPLYNAFLDAYRGRELPDANGIRNTLVSRYKVPDGEAGKVAGRLLRSAEEAGLFQVGGPTRMIIPTPATQERSADDSLHQSDVPTAIVTRGPTGPTGPTGATGPTARFPKIIEGALDLMPAGPPWDEAEYREWLSFFDQACRVYYRISRTRSAEADSA
jgi:hypothetical protein